MEMLVRGMAQVPHIVQGVALVKLDPYNRMWLRNNLLLLKQAISENDKERGYELCDDIRAVFCAAKGDIVDEDLPPAA